MLNPHGARMYLYPLETLRSHAMMKYIEEWLSPNFQELMFQPLVLLIFATFSVLALSSKRLRLLDLFLLLATAAGALRSARNIPFFVLIAMPLLVEHSWNWLTAHSWGQWLTKPEKREVGFTGHSEDCAQPCAARGFAVRCGGSSAAACCGQSTVSRSKGLSGSGSGVYACPKTCHNQCSMITGGEVT